MTCSLTHVWAQVPRKASTRDNGFLCVVKLHAHVHTHQTPVGPSVKHLRYIQYTSGAEKGEKHKSV